MRRTWVCCPPNGRGTGECLRASARRKGRGFPAGSVRRRRTVDTEHRRDVLAKEACFANRSGGNRFRRLRRFLYTPEPDALFPKRPSPVRIIFERNPCTDQKNVLHLHTDSRSSGFAVETVDVAQSVRVTDMAKGFATLENGGVYQDNSCIDKIMFKDHEVLKHKNTRKNVYSSASAYMITDCMKDAVKNGTGKNAQVKGQIIAGKTGTTNDYKDAWFCGYSRYYTTSVWVGCDDSKPMDNLTGSSYPSKIFSDYMTKVHKGKIKKDFKMPNTVYRKDGDLFSKDIDDTLHETVLENILKEQIKKAENAVEDFEAFTITDGESAYLLDDKYQKVCTAIEKVDDSTQKAKFRQRIEDHYDNLLEEQKKWKDAMETYVTQKEQQRIAENEKAEKEAVQKRQVYEQQQNIKLVKSYISRLDVMDTYDDTAEDIITKLQEALKKCEDYDTYDELNQKAEQAIERVRNLNSDTTTTESN